MKLTGRNEVIVDAQMQTNIPGVFSAGDANAKRFRQITLSTAEGTIAALNAVEFIHKLQTNETLVVS